MWRVWSLTLTTSGGVVSPTLLPSQKAVKPKGAASAANPASPCSCWCHGMASAKLPLLYHFCLSVKWLGPSQSLHPLQEEKENFGGEEGSIVIAQSTGRKEGVNIVMRTWWLLPAIAFFHCVDNCSDQTTYFFHDYMVL